MAALQTRRHMSQDLRSGPSSLAERCGEVLHYLWDPIGVRGVPPARDEYDMYVPGVLKLLEAGANEKTIATHLLEIERQRMAVGALDAERAGLAAQAISMWKEWYSDEEVALRALDEKRRRGDS